MPSLEYIVTSTLVISTVIIVAIELISLVVRRAIKVAGGGPVVLRDVSGFARVLEVLLIAFSITRITGLSSELTALTISGIGALAVSLALQTTLSNIISGILLVTDGVIRAGDTIEYSGVKGEVVRIALRTTWIKTESGSIAVVSNSSLSSGPLINHSGANRLKKRYRIE